MHIQVTQIAMKLIFINNERDSTSPIPILLSIHLGGVGRESISAFSSVVTSFPALFISGGIGVYAFIVLPFLVNIPVEALPVILCIP